MRSWLRIAAFDDKALAPAARAHADRIVFDLASAEPGKLVQARAGCAAFLRLSSGLCRYVIVHDFASGQTEGDLAIACADGADGIILAGTSDGAEVQRLDVHLSALEAVNGGSVGRTKIVARCDTAAGALASASFREKSARLEALCWSPEALARNIGAPGASTGERQLISPLQQAQAMIVLAAAAAGAAAIDVDESGAGPDPGSFKRLCQDSQSMGFAGMMTADVSRIAIANEVFAQL